MLYILSFIHHCCIIFIILYYYYTILYYYYTWLWCVCVASFYSCIFNPYYFYYIILSLFLPSSSVRLSLFLHDNGTLVITNS